jgi:hypothetical protein
VITRGDSSRLRRLNCACASGRVTQTADSKGQVFNALTELLNVEDRGDACERDPRIAKLRPPKETVDSLDYSKSHAFCGWVSVNSRSRNVTIIDNRYDAAILASGFPLLTKGNYRSVYGMQCACVRGKMMKTVNQRGTVFNSFREIENSKDGVARRSYHRCVGIQWR